VRRAFDLDVLRGPRSAGRMRLLATIEDPAIIGRILARLGRVGPLSSSSSRAEPSLISPWRSGRIGAMALASSALWEGWPMTEHRLHVSYAPWGKTMGVE
jgi:hypothetical protein